MSFLGEIFWGVPGNLSFHDFEIFLCIPKTLFDNYVNLFYNDIRILLSNIFYSN